MVPGQISQLVCAKISAVAGKHPSQVMLEFKVGKVPTLVYNGAQFSYLRSDLTEFLYLQEKHDAHFSYSVSCSGRWKAM